MSKSLDPSNLGPRLSPPQLRLAQSIHTTLNGGVDLGTPKGDHAGVYTQFEKGNGSGVLIRVAANGVLNTGAKYNWGAPNVGVAINHGLLRKPIGFWVVDKDKTVDVYRTVAPDENQITLAPTDATASVTVYVF